MRTGRPKKGLDSLPENWQEEVTDAYRIGKSDMWVRARVLDCMSDDLWYRFLEEEPDFSRIVYAGRKLAQAWWEDHAEDHATGKNKDGNANSLKFNMINRFRDAWKDRQIVEQKTEHSISIENVDELEKYLADNGIDPNKL